MAKTVRAPFGRMPEHVAKLTDDERQRAAIRAGCRIGDDDTLKVFTSRAFMARMIRNEEKNSPSSKWSPVVKLSPNEGY